MDSNLPDVGIEEEKSEGVTMGSKTVRRTIMLPI